MGRYVIALCAIGLLLVVAAKCASSARTPTHSIESDATPTPAAALRDDAPAPNRLTAIVEKLEADGILPTLDRTETVAGIDTDGNGVRDDIDAYIAQRFDEPSERGAVTQYARGYQTFLLADVADIDAVLDANRARRVGAACVFHRFEAWWDSGGAKSPFTIVESIQTLTVNTKARLLASIQLGRALNGQSWPHLSGDTCEN